VLMRKSAIREWSHADKKRLKCRFLGRKPTS